MFPKNLSSFSVAFGALQMAARLAAAQTVSLPREVIDGTQARQDSRFTDETPDDTRFRQGIHLSIGTPRQNVYLTPVITENATYLVDPSFCNSWTVCEDFAGGLFSPDESATWNFTATGNDTTAGFMESTLSNIVGNVFTGNDVGSFPGASSPIPLDTVDLAFVTGINATQTPEQTPQLLAVSNTLGLGAGSTFLTSLKAAGIISMRAFGFYNNTIDLGALPENKVAGPRFTFPILPDALGGLRVTVADVDVDGTSIMGGVAPFRANIAMMKSTNADTLLPPTIFNGFMAATGGNATILETLSSPALGGWNDTTVPFTNHTVTITLSNGVKMSAGMDALRGQVAELDGTGLNTASISMIQAVGNDTDSIPMFGQGFLRAVYVYVDYEDSLFELMNVSTSTGTGTGAGAIQTQPADGAASAGRGGMVAGGLVLLASAVVAVAGVF